MSVISALFEKRAIDASKFGLGDDMWPSSTDAGVYVDKNSAMTLVSVYACVTLISDAISTMPVDNFRRTQDGRQPAPAPKWMLQPNVETSWPELVDRTLDSLLKTGNGCLMITARDGLGFPSELWPLHPDDYKIRRDSARRKVYDVGGRTYRQFTAAQPDGQILQIMGHSADGLVGMSPIDQARQAIGLGLATEKFGNKFFGNGSQLSGVVELPTGSNPTEKQLEDWRAMWRRKYSGLDNAFQPTVLANGATWKPITIPPDNAQFIETRRFTVAEVARLYRVPPHLIGDVERSTSWGTGIEEQNIGFVTFTLNPWIARLESAFSQLTPRGQYVKWNVNALLRGDAQGRANVYKAGIQDGWMNRNEARLKEDMEPVDGLDGFLTPVQAQPQELSA